MAVKSLYFKNVTTNGALSLQDGGTAPATGITTTGWTVAKLASPNFSLLAVGTKATVFGTADALTTPTFTAASCWRSENPFVGQFANTSWSMVFRVRAVSSASSQTGAVKVRVWKSATAAGTGATQLTSAILTGTTTAALSTTVSASSTVTWATPGAQLLNNEYLWVQCEWSIGTTSGANQADSVFYIESTGVITTPDFVATIAGTSALADANSTLAGTGLGVSTGTGGLAAASATTIPSSGIGRSTGTGALAAASATTIPSSGISGSTGTGSLIDPVSALSGVGTITAVALPRAVVSWVELSGVELLPATGTGVLAAQRSAVAGTGNATFTTITGIGALVAQNSTLAGTGTVTTVGGGITGTGVLAALPPKRSNFCLQSQTIDSHPPWDLYNVTIGSNAIAAPDGTTTADSIIEDTANTNHFVLQEGIQSSSAATVHTVSMHAKAGNCSWVKLYSYAELTDRWVNFNLTTGTIGQASHGGMSPVMTALGNGWYRCSFVYTPSFSSVHQVGVFIANGDTGIAVYPGTGLNAYVWGVQLERGSVVNGYLPTTTTAVSVDIGLAGSGAVSAGVITGTGALQAIVPSRTNLALQSETFDVSTWNKVQTDIAEESATAPNGTLTADQITDNTASFHYVYQDIPTPVTTGINYTYSVYAKAGTLSWFQLVFSALQKKANFDLVNGAVGFVGAGATAQITAVGDGWYRCSITGSTINPNETVYLYLSSGNTSGVPSYTGTGTGTLYFWGAQLEVGGAATAYIPTTTTAVTTNDTLISSGAVSGTAGTGALVAIPTGSAINLLLQSQTLNVSPWSIGINTLGTITADAIAAPDATITAEKVTDAAAANFHGVSQVYPLVVSTAYSVSVYAKAGTMSWLQLATGLGPKTANFDLVNGATGKVSSGVTSQITAAGGGWYRCSMSFSAAATFPDNLLFLLAPNDITGSAFYTGTGTGTIYLWGAQLQLGSTTTAYIPTTTTQGISDYNTALVGSGAVSGLGIITGTGVLTVPAFGRTNYLSRSEEFDVAPWTTSHATITANASLAPDGTNNADQLSDDVANAGHYVWAASGVASPGSAFTFSVYAKASTLTWLQLQIGGQQANFDVSSGVVGQKSGAATSSIEPAANGFFRCSITMTAGAGNISAFLVTVPANQLGISYTGSGASLFIWGAQLEKSGAATAYIPTTTAAVSTNETLAGSGAVSGAAGITGTGALVATLPSSVTNLASQSETLNVTPRWATNAATVTANVATLAPNGTATAEQLTDTTDFLQHYLYQLAIHTTAGLPYTFSVYAKAGTLSWFQIYSSNIFGQANFNLTTGVIGNRTDEITPQMVAVGGGWYRCSITYTAATGADTNLVFVLSNGDTLGLAGYTGTGTGSILLWGVQAELGTAPTAYIPTTTAPVTITPKPLDGVGDVSAGIITGTGVLVVENVTGVINFALQSETLDVSPWAINAISVTANAAPCPIGTTISPAGSLTAELVTDDTSNAPHCVYQLLTLPFNNKLVTYSIYAKAGTLSWLQIVASIGWCNFNLSAGTFGNNNATSAKQITPVGGGWYRCSITAPSGGSTSVYYVLGNSDLSASLGSYTGTGTGTIYLFGAQIEKGVTPSLYIPTTTVAVAAFGFGTVSSAVAQRTYVKVAGVWQPAVTSVKDAGVWKVPDKVYVKTGGVWKEV